MKTAKYIGLVFFGLVINFFGFLGVILTTGNMIAPFVIAVVLAVAHICLRRVLRKDTGASILWYTLSAQLLPVIASAVWLMINLVMRYNTPGYDFKGLELWFAEFTLVILAISTVISVVYDRVKEKKTALGAKEPTK